MQDTYNIEKRGEHEWIVSANGNDLLRFERKTTAVRTAIQADLLCKKASSKTLRPKLHITALSYTVACPRADSAGTSARLAELDRSSNFLEVTGATPGYLASRQR
jgi:hypothetical protein